MAAPSIGATVAAFSCQMAGIAAASAQMSVISTKTNVQIGAEYIQKRGVAIASPSEGPFHHRAARQDLCGHPNIERN